MIIAWAKSRTVSQPSIAKSQSISLKRRNLFVSWNHTTSSKPPSFFIFSQFVRDEFTENVAKLFVMIHYSFLSSQLYWNKDYQRRMMWQVVSGSSVYWFLVKRRRNWKGRAYCFSLIITVFWCLVCIIVNHCLKVIFMRCLTVTYRNIKFPYS